MYLCSFHREIYLDIINDIFNVKQLIGIFGVTTVEIIDEHSWPSYAQGYAAVLMLAGDPEFSKRPDIEFWKEKIGQLFYRPNVLQDKRLNYLKRYIYKFLYLI
ncbi:hypothetical protein OQJ02_05110 [Legionella sp. PATHC032]|uniref:hypothetical protein n=1 Tax=Legionella sp. PATHC032 TaxID=2992039 RepID=UPI001B16AF7B|nr:hypothetical protein [Legionella sp. PATHC032]MCW8421009.1 hypothetical protein [Legionella sp. PATHC032]HAZ7573804.1 hypothetical protein [Legionella pneumophila]HBA1634310.1 hypothetical protein [Legionella pneumophila]